MRKLGLGQAHIAIEKSTGKIKMIMPILILKYYTLFSRCIDLIPGGTKQISSQDTVKTDFIILSTLRSIKDYDEVFDTYGVDMSRGYSSKQEALTVLYKMNKQRSLAK